MYFVYNYCVTYFSLTDLDLEILYLNDERYIIYETKNLY